MEIFNKKNTKNTGQQKILQSWMLISPQNTQAHSISVQMSEIPIGSEQPIHKHEPEQCYYIINGKGLMIIEKETCQVSSGDAIYIPSNKEHGIKNVGNCILEYLTTNSPPFDEQYENKLWAHKKKKEKLQQKNAPDRVPHRVIFNVLQIKR